MLLMVHKCMSSLALPVCESASERWVLYLKLYLNLLCTYACV